MTDAPNIKVVAGKPSDALQRSRINSWSFGSLVPRHNYVHYKAREGRTNLETLRLIRDRDPDAAQAVMNFLLLIGQGYHSEARNGEEIDQKASAYLSALDARVGTEYGGGMDMLVDVLALTLVTQGAQALEIQIADDLSEVVDFHPIDPARISAKREKDTQRLMWGMQVGRGVAGADAEGFLEFSPRQFRYIPLHPDVDDPYGRSPILAALTAIFFKIQVLEDLRAVVHNQGYPRLDVEVVEEVITNNLPAGATIEQRQKLVADMQIALQASFAALHPDDAIIHPSSVDVGYLQPGGTVIDIAALDVILDKQIISGLKQLPILLGRNEGATTTHATVQWRIHVLMIEALRRRMKRLIEWAHGTALQVAGFQATAHVTFEELQTNDQLVDAQALETEVRAWASLVDRGWAEPNEAAQAILQHDAVAEPVPQPEPPTTDRRPPVTTRAAPDEERTKLEDELQKQAAAAFTRLAAAYPIADVAESFTGNALDDEQARALVGRWFETNPGEVWSQELADTLTTHYLDAFNIRGRLALDELGIAGAFDLKNPAMIKALRDLGAERVTGINDETRSRIVTQLVEGSQAGEGVPALGERLQALIQGMSESRARLIAVTETATAWGQASQETYERNGVERKRWISTRDSKTTEQCLANDAASPVGIDEDFPSGDPYPPRFPGCRCSTAPVIEGYETPSKPWLGE